MALKLFSPGQAQTQAKKRSEFESTRAVELQEVIARKFRELADVEKTHAEALERQKKAWDKANDAQTTQNKALLKEVQILEERKKEALVPLISKEKELDTKASALAALETSLDLKDLDITRTMELLQEKLDLVSEREQNADETDQRLSNRERGIKMQQEDIRVRSEGLTKIIQETDAYVREAKQELERLMLVNKTRENHLSERERLVNEKEESLRQLERQINDKYDSLQRAIAELKKQGIHGTSIS